MLGEMVTQRKQSEIKVNLLAKPYYTNRMVIPAYQQW